VKEGADLQGVLVTRIGMKAGRLPDKERIFLQYRGVS